MSDRMHPAVVDRAAGTLVGLAVGDALGAGYELTTPPSGKAQMIGGGLGGWAPGEWTDDTQMAICIAEVTATGTPDAAAVGERFLAWFRTDPSDVGNQTRAVLGQAASGSEMPAIARDHFARHPSSSAGNGSLMRTAPVALAHLGDDDAIIAAAREISALTHADPLAGDACAIWCIGIDRAVREGRLDGVWDGVALLEPGARVAWAVRLREAETVPPGSFTPNGYVVTALQAAWAAIRQTPVPPDERCRHLQDALHAVVRVGHDTDTVAAIAGSMLGARWGASAVPLGWQAMVHGWPGYRQRQLVSLAVLSATGGLDDELGWPSSPDVRPQYTANYPIDDFAIALPDDPGVVLGSSLSSAAAETDVMLSLCRMGTEPPPGVGEVYELFLTDSPRFEHNPNLDFVLRDAAAQIAAWRDDDKTVFVHCAAGVSRTGAVAAAYLARRLGIGGLDALERVVAAHPMADPNPAFLVALAKL